MSFFKSLGKMNPTYQAWNTVKGLVSGKDPGKAQLAQILAIHKQLQAQQGGLYANALQQQKKGLGAINTGYDKALGEVANSGYSAKQSVLSREQQNLGTMNQGLTNAGLGSTSVMQNLQRGVYSDTNRNLAQVDEMLANMRSGLQAQKAQAQAGQYGALAGLFQNQNQANVGLGSSLINTIGSVQHQDPNAWLGSLMDIGGELGSAAIIASDRRLKRDVRLVDIVDGVNVYEFRYKSDPSSLWLGVMADEVERIDGAVVMVDGYRFVDYSKLPVKFKKVA